MASTAPPREGLLELAERLARTTAELIHAGRARGIVDVDTKSTATDMVTEFDRAAEAHIVAELRRHRPDDAIVGEEGTDRPGTSGISWLIDPIDGTTNFLYGLPGYAVSIAAADEEGPLVGAVAVPSFGEIFTAERGRGAWCNGEPIRCSDRSVLGESLIATGFSYVGARRARQAEVLRHLLPQVRDIRRFGAAAVDLCLVGAGRVDAYFEAGMNAWDSAAGGLVAQEAGAVLGGLDGGPPRPDALVAAAPGIFAALQQVLVEAGAAHA